MPPQFLGCTARSNCFASRICGCILRETSQWKNLQIYLIYRLRGELSKVVGMAGVAIGIGVLADSPLPPLQTSTPPPPHLGDLSCRDVLKCTAWLQIREHWQMSGSLFFWVKTESRWRQNLCWQIWRMLWERWKSKALQGAMAGNVRRVTYETISKRVNVCRGDTACANAAVHVWMDDRTHMRETERERNSKGD